MSRAEPLPRKPVAPPCLPAPMRRPQEFALLRHREQCGPRVFRVYSLRCIFKLFSLTLRGKGHCFSLPLSDRFLGREFEPSVSLQKYSQRRVPPAPTQISAQDPWAPNRKGVGQGEGIHLGRGRRIRVLPSLPTAPGGCDGVAEFPFLCEPVTMKVEARTQKVQKSPVSCSAPQVGRVRTSPPGTSSLPWRFLFQIIFGPFFRICMITHHCTKFFPQNTCHWCDLEWSDHNSEILGFPHLWLPCGESSQETLKDVARSSPVFPSQSNYRMNCCFILFCFSYTGFPSLGPWAAGMLINLTPWLIPPPSPLPQWFQERK